MTNDIAKLIADETRAVEAAEERGEQIRNLEDVKVTRGHGRSKTLQVRLNDEEYDHLVTIARASDLPVSTLARAMLLEQLRTSADPLEQIESGVASLRRQMAMWSRYSGFHMRDVM